MRVQGSPPRDQSGAGFLDGGGRIWLFYPLLTFTLGSPVVVVVEVTPPAGGTLTVTPPASVPVGALTLTLSGAGTAAGWVWVVVVTVCSVAGAGVGWAVVVDVCSVLVTLSTIVWLLS